MKCRKTERAEGRILFLRSAFLLACLIKRRLWQPLLCPIQEVSGAKLEPNERHLCLLCTEDHLKPLMRRALGNMGLMFRSDAIVHHVHPARHIASLFSSFMLRRDRATVPPSVREGSSYKTYSRWMAVRTVANLRDLWIKRPSFGKDICISLQVMFI